MKRIAYLSFYFKPDLCAGSFRNSPLAQELAEQAKLKDIIIEVYTTLPNRYSSFNPNAPELEEFENLRIHRISLPAHKSGMIDQVFSFWRFYMEVKKLNKDKKASLVFASSSRLFTAYLGYKIAKKSNALLYLDIRDIFVDTMNDIFKSIIVKKLVMPFLKIIESKTFSYATHINLISGGFKDYFRSYNSSSFSYYTNGIDQEFINKKAVIRNSQEKLQKLVVYAGNIGEGQGLHRIIPHAAKLLGDEFRFLIVGDGGSRKLLEREIMNLGINNVILQNPMNRTELQNLYDEADYLFLHLNDYPAFRKVLPSKIFELATFNKPILAGVSGYPAEFIKSEVSHSFVFEPCDVMALVMYLSNSTVENDINRETFMQKFTRKRINVEMANSILSYL